MSRQAAFVLILTVIGLAGVGVWSLQEARQLVTAGFWFDDIHPEGVVDLPAGQEPLGAGDVARIESLARAELQAAFAAWCLPITGSPTATYRVRVRQSVAGLVVGGSRSMPGLGGHGDVSFAALASSAAGFAPAGADRATIVRAIGRGIGRTAAHELAHQVLGAREIHSTRDRLGYEYPDVRPEHFYGELHWTVAAAPLEARLGRCS